MALTASSFVCDCPNSILSFTERETRDKVRIGDFTSIGGQIYWFELSMGFLLKDFGALTSVTVLDPFFDINP